MMRIFFILYFSATQLLALNCREVKTLMDQYLAMHYKYKKFDEAISERTFENMLKAWDPGKLYFYDQDVTTLRNQMAKNLHTTVGKAKCEPISQFVTLYDKRFMERQAALAKIMGLKYTFDKDDKIELDRKKITFATTSEELEERWRQRIKFQLFQLQDTAKKKGDQTENLKKVQKRNERMEKDHKETDQVKIYSRFLNAFASALDPHSDYMGPDVLEDFRIQTSLSLEGIGAVLRSEDGFTIIQSMVAGGAAARSGLLRLEDKIIAVAQEKGDPVDVIDMDLREVVKLIRGKGGTTVHLTILRDKTGKAQKLIAPIVREKVQLTDRTAKSKVFTTRLKTKEGSKDFKVGVALLPSFYVDFEGMHARNKDFRSSARDLLREIETLKKEGVDAMILDLRSNGGGSLSESVKIGGMFIDKGPIVQIKERSGKVISQNDTDAGIPYDGPLLVMISRQSASASEIVAGALKDYDRAIILGDDHTFGKGTVQNLNEIGKKLGAIKVTISNFYRPSGASTQLQGVDSDLVLPSLLSALDIGEKFYDYPLEWDTVKPAKYSALGRVKAHIPALKPRMEARLKTDKEFKKVFADIKEYEDGKAEATQVNMNNNAKDKKDKKDDEDESHQEVADDSDPIQLSEDPHLQESLRIATDYSLLLQGQALDAKTHPEIVGLEQMLNAKAKPKKKSKKK
jgi:carboxyl-terminal processing protease